MTTERLLRSRAVLATALSVAGLVIEDSSAVPAVTPDVLGCVAASGSGVDVDAVTGSRAPRSTASDDDDTSVDEGSAAAIGVAAHANAIPIPSATVAAAAQPARLSALIEISDRSGERA
ncbi:hypothetical protein JRC04_28320 [Mycolicibacterium sp. S2-37]|uniref:hypothetical protein n=1 Tax=Mycolicibacterium sp. S2-37 TaxID=2810297 RepID=UPI001A93B404|nr:hypothetical protein [Mycolicibacterium sp. S2-37]MBO0681386.1 hypothetical protein [Mycolicibacterium sp. S2-37]